jgi:Omp85 superfamily domain
MGAVWSTNREVAYISEGNKQLFYKDDTKSVFRRFKFQTGVTYRPNLYLSHDVDISFHSNKIDRKIAFDNNPDFFLLGRSEQNYFSLRYRGTYDARDLQLFPMRGLLCGVEITKDGLGAQDDVNTLNLTSFFELHIPLTKNISVSSQSKFQYGAIRDKQPFWNYQGLGYGRDYLRGYELYIIHGLDYVYTKTSLRARIVDGNVNWKKKMPKAFREMPYQLYLTANYDYGYVNDPFYAEGNPLVNRSLYGGGPGIALVVYHTFSLHVEYNYNHLGENGLFLHSKTSF